MKLANKKIVEFMRDNWVIPMNNNSQFANENNIDEKTVRRMREDETYQISLITIQKICEAKELKLYEFFKMVNV